MKLPKQYKGYKISRNDKQRWFATTDDKHKTITINVKKSLKAGGEKELQDTLKHEFAHVDNPQATEKEIEKQHKSDSVKDTMFKGLI